MKKNVFILVFCILLLIILTLLFGVKKVKQPQDTLMNKATYSNKKTSDEQNLPIRRPAVAGAFYPEGRLELQEMVDNFLAKAGEVKIDGTPRVLIVPHAGYVYSGGVAAFGYKAIEGQSYDTVILIGPSHTAYFEGISVYPKGFYETPLGQIRIDDVLATRLINANEKISYYPQAHISEHDLEVQLPFLQTILPGKDWKIVPILMGNPNKETVSILAEALKGNTSDKTLVVISTDLSHYPEYETANKVDKETIEAILTKDVDGLDAAISKSIVADYPGLDTCACGEGPIKVGMLLAKEWEAVGQLLKYANSGDVSGDYSRVVGYASILFESKVKSQKSKVNENSQTSKEDREKLLEIARETLEDYLSTRKIPEIEVESEQLQEHLGAFVTLRTQSGQLRGCIGRFSPTDKPLYKVVQDMAIAAATQDIRFLPVSREELDNLEIEISVLSDLTKVNDWQEIEVGKHGVEVVQGSKRGVFLPQVATENDWDLETFMNELCENKAGIARDAWKTGKAELYVFTAEVFEEGEIGE